MSRFLCDKFQNIEPYVPGEQPQQMQYIKLNTNECPYPPSPEVLAAINTDEVAKLRLYPDPTVAQLNAAIAAYYSVPESNVLVGNGSDEILAFAFLAFGRPQSGVAYADITYGFYPVYAELFGIQSKIIPLKQDFSLDIAKYCTNEHMVVIANPNAPTGLALSRDELITIIKNNPDQIVLIDEAYVDFGAQSAVDLTATYENLLVVQTFSKSRSLAGARLGFAIGAAPLIADLNSMKFSFNPYNINRLSLLAGIAAINDQAYFQNTIDKIIKTREQTKSELRALGFTVTDSMTNFLFAAPPKISGAAYYQALREHGILVRYFAKERISDYVRITIGTDEEMRQLIAATKNILQEA